MKQKTNEKRVFKYTGPSSLKEIEERLLEIDAEKSARIHNAKESSSGDFLDQIMEEADIEYLDVEKTQLQFKRQFILDKRESWLPKTIWNLVVPMIVAIITAYITTAILIK